MDKPIALIYVSAYHMEANPLSSLDYTPASFSESWNNENYILAIKRQGGPQPHWHN